MKHTQENIPQGVIEVVHLTSPSISGGKEWVGVLYGSKQTFISSSWGQTGRINNTSTKLCSGAEFQKIVRDKLSKGYVFGDTYDLSMQCWDSQKINAAIQLPKSQSKHRKLETIFKDIEEAPTDSLSWDF